MKNISNYLMNYKAQHPGNKMSEQRILKITEYESMKFCFGELLTYDEFCELASLKSINNIEIKETKYRSKKADLVLKDLPDDEQAKKVRRYTKRLYKWFAVYITKEQVQEMYKMSDADMHRRYLKFIKEN